MHTATTTIATTIRIKIMGVPIDTPTTIPIDPAFVVTGVEVLLVVLALSVNGIESVI